MKGLVMKNLLVLGALLTCTPALASFKGFNASGDDLGHFSDFKCSTGMTCTVVGGKFNVVSSPSLVGPLTLENGEVITNATDDTVSIQSDDEVLVLEAMGFEAKGAKVAISADQSDDVGDTFNLSVSTSDVFSIDSEATPLLSFSTAGLMTMVSEDTLSNVTDDSLIFASNDEVAIIEALGFEAKGAKIAISADQSDDSGDTFNLSVSTADVFSIDSESTPLLSFSTAGAMTLVDSETITNASDVITLGFDDAAANLSLLAFEATNSSLFLKADESDDNGDDWAINSVASGNTLTISNDASGSQVAKVTIAASDGDLTLTGGITGDGGDSLSGLLQAQVAITTTSITAVQCGSTFVGDSADVIVLPEASTVLGCRITFIAGTADDVDIDPADGTDTIGSITASGGTINPSAGDAIRMTDIGTSVTLEAVGADLWVAVAHNGPITDVN